MNKRNFFKGLMALLAMPANIYAKVFERNKERDRLEYLFNSSRGIFTGLSIESFSQIRIGMFFTTTAEWGLNGSIFEVVGVEQSNCAFVKPFGPSFELQGWPSGMSRKLYFERATLSAFNFYARVRVR